jgi:thiamine biosynthesis lipoprotein
MENCNRGRRRILKILAAAGPLANLRTGRSFAATPEPYTWHGTALGARSSLTLYHVNETEGARLVRRIGEELVRLEGLFSLYRVDSAVSTLNRQGYIDFPSADMVRLLSEAHAISEITGGAFDVTVQPLWNAYAAHYRRVGDESTGPAAEAVDAALKKVDYRGVEIDSMAIRLARTGMSVTLNGIAQGYITDRIADLLRAEGLRHVLIDVGEVRALDSHPTGRPWAVGLLDPAGPQHVSGEVEIRDQAVATSAGAGTRFDRAGVHHHIFDPGSGKSSNHYTRLSVVGERATLADALSTGLYNLSPERALTVLDSFPGYSAYVVYRDGRAETLGPGSL